MPDAATPIIVLFRRDLRVRDNRALAAAADSGRPVVPLFLLDERADDARPLGGASRWWLHHSLAELQQALAERGAPLWLRRGRTADIVREIVRATGAGAVLWNRRYAPADIAVDLALKADLHDDGLEAESFDGFLLHEPTRVAPASGDFYKVFTPFHRRLAGDLEPRDPVDSPKKLRAWDGKPRSDKLDDLDLLPRKPDWSGGLAERWRPGESGAHSSLRSFVEEGLAGYARGRDLPGDDSTSRLSPHLAFGEITPFQIMAALRGKHGAGAETFRKEVVWREFCYHLLCHRPKLHSESFRPEFEDFPWRGSDEHLAAWRRGRTGYPIVDAGMRQLWRTGWMHNRVRMIVASFLIKDLLIDWREGEIWFWDTLVDADAASNPANWQWVAGSGADAAPYFRVFNPVLQGEKFDPKGRYVRCFVPELAELPDRYIHRPWEAPASVLKDCGIELGRDYPKPIVDHAEARKRALKAYEAIRSG